jgi:hypothetical protein
MRLHEFYVEYMVLSFLNITKPPMTIILTGHMKRSQSSEIPVCLCCLTHDFLSLGVLWKMWIEKWLPWGSMAWNKDKLEFLVLQLPYEINLQVPSYSWEFVLLGHERM